MVKCSKCLNSAIWVCRCSYTYLCKDHAREHSIVHLDQNTSANLAKLELPLSDSEMIELKLKVERRIGYINNYRKKILHETSVYIRKIETMCVIAIKKLDDDLTECYKFLNPGFYDEKFKEKIDRFSKTNYNPYKMNKELNVHTSVADFFSNDLLNDMEFIEGADAVEELYNNFDLCVQGHISYVLCVAISSDNKYAASGSQSDRIIRLWDIKEKVQVYFLKGHTDYLTGLAFSPDGKYIVSASMDKTVRVWSITHRNQQAILEEHTNCVTGVSISASSKYAISASWDTTLCVWDLTTFKLKSKITGTPIQ